MNIFKTTEPEIGTMDGRSWAEWRAQWVSDFKNISAIIRRSKNEVAGASQIYDTIDNSSFMAAGRSIAQRNLCDSRVYANVLMQTLYEARAIRQSPKWRQIRCEYALRAVRDERIAARTVSRIDTEDDAAANACYEYFLQQCRLAEWDKQVNQSSYVTRANELIDELLSDIQFRDIFMDTIDSRAAEVRGNGK